MLTHEIVSRTQALLPDPDYWTSARLIAFINDCVADLSLHFGITITGYKTFTSVSGQQSYGLPQDFIALHMLYWGDGYWLDTDSKCSLEDVYRNTSNPAETGQPEKWFIHSKQDLPEIWVYPTFDAAQTVEMFYWRRPPTVVNNNDEPLVPRDWHRSIVQYCRRQTWVEDELHNYNPSVFDVWWESEKMKMQISDNVVASLSDSITIGDFDDNLPSVGRSVGVKARIKASDGTIW